MDARAGGQLWGPQIQIRPSANQQTCLLSAEGSGVRGGRKRRPVKKGNETLSDALGFFQRRLGAKHAFQVVLDAEYVDSDCFQCESPVVVPARTFLSQLF